MRTTLRDIFRTVLWLGGIAAIALPVLVVTQPASFQDGLLLSAVLLSTFLVTVCVVSLIGVAVRKGRLVKLGEGYVFGSSLRQGSMAGMLVVLLLVLQLLRVITIVDALLFIGLAILVDLYLGSRAEAR